MSRKKVSRRLFLGTALAGSAGASVSDGETGRDSDPEPSPCYAAYLADRDSGKDKLPTTEENIEGPFYRPDAPFRTRLYGKEDRGEVLIVSGTVIGRDGQPIAGAVVDVWHANHLGHYDNGDPDHLPAEGEYRWRGRIRTSDAGRYQFETIRPGNYRLTPLEFRAAHIHLKASAPGYRSLITQLFFRGDPNNRTDPWFRPSTMLDIQADAEGRFRASFRIVLARARKRDGSNQRQSG